MGVDFALNLRLNLGAYSYFITPVKCGSRQSIVTISYYMKHFTINSDGMGSRNKR